MASKSGIDPTAPLKPIRYEKFAQLCAAGIKPADVYISLGYTAKRAGACAHRLLQRADICARVEHLHAQHIKEQSEQLKQVTQNVIITKQRVIDRLDHLSRLAESDKRYGAAIRAEHLLGVEVGLFVISMDHNMKWDGDLSKLDAAQLEKVKLYMEEKHYGDDKERLEREKAAYEAEWIAQHAVADDGETIQ